MTDTTSAGQQVNVMSNASDSPERNQRTSTVDFGLILMRRQGIR